MYINTDTIIFLSYYLNSRDLFKIMSLSKKMRNNIDNNQLWENRLKNEFNIICKINDKNDYIAEYMYKKSVKSSIKILEVYRIESGVNDDIITCPFCLDYELYNYKSLHGYYCKSCKILFHRGCTKALGGWGDTDIHAMAFIKNFKLYGKQYYETPLFTSFSEFIKIEKYLEIEWACSCNNCNN